MTSLTEKYRPARLSEVVGQSEITNSLAKFASRPYPCAFLLSGPSGCGKTSTGYALAAEIGVDVSQSEFGGLHVVASGEQTADTVRAKMTQLHSIPFTGSGWRALIVNECDDMNAKVQSLWLDILEDLPPRTVIIFTTNEPDKLSERFRDRTTHYEFRANAADLEADANALISRIWISELGHNHAPTVADLGEVAVRGRLSFRRVVKALERKIDAVRPDEPVIVETAKPSRIDGFETIPLEPIPLAELGEPIIIAKQIPAPAPVIEPERLDPRPIPPVKPIEPAKPDKWWHKAVRVSPTAPEPVVILAQPLPVNATATMRDKAIESIVLMMDCARDVAVKAADYCLAEKPHTNALTLVPAMLMRISNELRGVK